MDYTTDYGGAQAFQSLIPMFIIWFCFMTLLLLLALGNYVFRGIGIYKMSENRDIPNGWLGFIPFVHNYQLGKLAGEIEFCNKKIKNTGVWLLVLPIAFGFVFVIGYLIMLLPFLFRTISWSTMGGNPTESEIASALSTFTISLVFFVLVLIAAQLFLYLFRGLALHKVFSYYSAGQKPVFFMILCIFIPLAEGILLFMHSGKPLLDEKETATNIEPA